MLRRLSVLALVALVHCDGPGRRPDAPDVAPFDATLRDTGPRIVVDVVDAPDTPIDGIPGAIVPPGWVLRRYAVIPEARVLAMAPDGDLFVSAPSMNTAGGADGGEGSIFVLSDDDHDGVAEVSRFFTGVRDVHGLAIAEGYVWFTTTDTLWRASRAPGQRMVQAPPERVGMLPMEGQRRWTHGVAVSAAGEVFVSTGVFGSFCSPTDESGDVVQVRGGSVAPTITGLRNPMYVRCHPTDSLCLASELGDDGGAMWNARERFVRIADGANYGYPCCSGPGDPVPSNADGGVDCSGVTPEIASSELHTTPFGFDWERGQWPAPYRDVFVVAFHGSFYSMPSWLGARIAYCQTDAVTHQPNGHFVDLVRGFAPDAPVLRRPADVAFGPDGRLFIADDLAGMVYALAPPGWMPNR